MVQMFRVPNKYLKMARPLWRADNQRSACWWWSGTYLTQEPPEPPGQSAPQVYLQDNVKLLMSVMWLCLSLLLMQAILRVTWKLMDLAVKASIPWSDNVKQVQPMQCQTIPKVLMKTRRCCIASVPPPPEPPGRFFSVPHFEIISHKGKRCNHRYILSCIRGLIWKLWWTWRWKLEGAI